MSAWAIVALSYGAVIALLLAGLKRIPRDPREQALSDMEEVAFLREWWARKAKSNSLGAFQKVTSDQPSGDAYGALGGSPSPGAN